MRRKKESESMYFLTDSGNMEKKVMWSNTLLQKKIIIFISNENEK